MKPTTKAVLIAGVGLGVLSGLPLVGMACCLWVVGGGFLSVVLYNNYSGEKADTGKGAVLGLLSGLVGAFVSTAINAVFQLLAVAASTWMDTMSGAMGYDALAGAGVAMLIVALFVISLLAYGLFGLLGGLLGAAILKK